MFNLILVVFSSYTNKIGSIYLLFQDKKKTKTIWTKTYIVNEQKHKINLFLKRF
jgi:hypothetical protein